MDENLVEIIVIVLTVVVGLLQPLVSKLLKKSGLNIPDEDDDETATDEVSEEASMRQITEDPTLGANIQQSTTESSPAESMRQSSDVQSASRPAMDVLSQSASMQQATDGPSSAESVRQPTYVPTGAASRHVMVEPSRTVNMWRTTVDPPQIVTEQQSKPKSKLAGNAYSVVEPARTREPLDKRKLIIYSEIMKPKFDDF